MRVARIRAGGSESYGIVSGEGIATMGEIRSRTGIPVPPSVTEFLFGGWAEEVAAHAGELEHALGLSECEPLPPIPSPPKIICAAFNYGSHARGRDTASSPARPVIVMKPATALAGARSEIACPSFVRELDYETELAVVIGRRTRSVSREGAASSIFGYMVMNDVSARDIQFGDGQFTRAKGFDTFAPCGPWITTREEAGEPARMRITTRVNGEARQDALAGEMTLSPEALVSELSRSMTLEAGDIISTGTPGGTVLDIGGAYLRDGDVIESSVSGLGTLRNRVRFTG
ncbi:MAG: fumarylacetoacetate hydrolase family protein [Thaumarchaeota archaeon]|nr:fumarylacetoacetate hydrolase family protein [Nitrososphaerota archaeon]RNJ71970.1 MAG: FAA hydrolase family protein [Thaumarchaeota archaeon S13]RNJ72032.1 MAG: FAA hydrolase family protein [Thaumarchaeota archaeon S14]RNJ73500.1 MAG: FAA hydrolase family protein [Thaumarchaeota archaeon S15]MDD9813752.1 fumarylacetoacetate hydrolase family protein [Nitrososphaerota archaeon]